MPEHVLMSEIEIITDGGRRRRWSSAKTRCGSTGGPGYSTPTRDRNLPAPRFTDVLQEAAVRISMEDRGRRMDSVMIERPGRSRKHECVCRNAFETGSEARAGIGKWIAFHNTACPTRRSEEDPGRGVRGPQPEIGGMINRQAWSRRETVRETGTASVCSCRPATTLDSRRESLHGICASDPAERCFHELRVDRRHQRQAPGTLARSRPRKPGRLGLAPTSTMPISM